MDVSTINRIVCVLLLTLICYRYARCGFCGTETCLQNTQCYTAEKGFFNCPITLTRQVCCAGFTGDFCLTPICKSGCPNGQTCTAPETCSCPPGYAKPDCTDIDECSTNNGGCQQACQNTQGSYFCSCNTGYKLNSNGKDCTDIDECQTNGGGCDHDCHNTQGSYVCLCIPGYNLANNGKDCADIDECSTNNGGCQQACQNTQGSYFCSCNTGYKLKSNDKDCTDINECSINNGGCDHVCENKLGSYTCSCNAGYTTNGKDCTAICTDGCQHGGTCTTPETCSCTPAYAPPSCTACSPGYYFAPDGKTCLAGMYYNAVGTVTTCISGAYCVAIGILGIDKSA